MDLFKFYSNDRIVVPDEDSYSVFKSYLMPLAIESNDTKCSSFSYNFDEKYSFEEDINSDEITNICENKTKVFFNLKISRNIAGFCYNKFVSGESRKTLNDTIENSLLKHGFKIISNFNNDLLDLIDLFSLIKNNDEKESREYTVFSLNKMYVVLNKNSDSHFDLLLHDVININDISQEIIKAYKVVDSLELKYSFSKDFGYLSSNVENLGHGLTIKTFISSNSDNISKLQDLNISNIKVNEKNKEEYVITTRFRLGYKPSSELFYHLCALSIIKNAKTNQAKLEDSTFEKSPSLFKDLIKKVYNSTFEKLSSIYVNKGINYNKYIEEILSTSTYSKIYYVRMYLPFFKSFYLNLLNKQDSDSLEKYFYGFNNENFTNLKAVKNSHIVKKLELNIERFIKGPVSIDYIRNTINGVLTEGVEVILNSIKDVGSSTEVNQLEIKFNLDLNKLISSLNDIHSKLMPILCSLDNNVVADSNLGYLTYNFYTIGSGFSLNCDIDLEKMKDESERSNIESLLNSKKDSFSFNFNLNESNTIHIHFNSFGKFICKALSDLCILVESISS